jgi:hypothetical protein
MLAGGDKDAQKMALQAATRPTTVSPAPTTPSAPGFPSTSFGGNTSQFTGSFGGNTSQFTGTPSIVTMSSTGKPMPVQPPQPEL